MKKDLFFLACLFGFVLASFQASAHPHAWIDYRTRILLNDDNKIIAIKEHWVFDEYYTEFALHDFDKNKSGKLDHDVLMGLANENLKNLKEFNYFTSLEEKGNKKIFASVSNVDSNLIEGHIALDFTLWLKEPVDAVGKEVSYRIYDPSYYASMLHDKKEPIVLEGKKAADCRHELTTPKPNVAMISVASAIDKNGKPPDELGAFFAQRMMITCQ